MGNCFGAESYSSSTSSLIWAGEDWNSLCKDEGESKRKDGGESKRKDGGENKRPLDGANGKKVSSASSGRREVRIKISKKELEKLMETIEAQGLPLEQVLPLLINKNYIDSRSALAEHGGHRPWRPALQSIPEVI